MWYGVPTIASRFLGYLMNLSLPFLFAQPAKTADLTQVYAIIPFLNVLFTYGLETAYFRFSQEEDKKKLYNTLNLSLIGSTIFFALLIWIFKDSIAHLAGLEQHPQYVNWMMWIIAFDTLATLPFARLRQENRPRKYALVRISGIMVTILVVIFFLGFLPSIAQKDPNSFFSFLYNREDPISYYLLGNLCGSIATLLLLLPEFRSMQFQFDKALWRKVMQYSYPLIIVGLGGMVNDMLSRLVYRHVVDLPLEAANKELGVFGNLYRLAVLVTVMIQAFRMAAEPFFFNRAKSEDAPRTYARVMKFFVIACCFMFLFIALYRDVLEAVITLKSKAWGEGIYIVPLLAMGNIFLGIYYNLSIWYKLSDRNMMGAYITIAGAVLTIVLNILLIPSLHYLGAALATFTCYLFMMMVSYSLGQKYYPIPYARKKLIAYLFIVCLLYGVHRGMLLVWDNLWFSIITGTGLLGVFSWFIGLVEHKELSQLPVVGRLLPQRR